jgi:hypothetical protein
VARKTRADTADAISRLADSSEDAVRNLVALPLRMLIGTLDFLEARLHKASDTLREFDPLDERVVELERRLDSLEHQTTSRRQSPRTTTAARQTTPTASSVESQRVEHSPGRHEEAPGSDSAADQGGA